VYGVGSGEAAIRLVTESKMVFDLCFVDEAMTCPAMSSTTLTSFATDSDTDEHVIGRMRKSGAVSYIVGCSANNDVENAHVGAGADAFLHKPSSTDIIARTVYTLFVFPPLHSCLFVDDDRIARSLAKRRLKRLAPRCDVQEAASVNEALEMVEKRKRGHPFDVIFLDEHLGAGMRGSEGAKVLRQRQCPSRLVSLSGDTGTVQEAGAPFGLYWSKPWPAAETITSDLFDLLLPTRRAASAQSGRENGGVSAASLRISLGTS
jgi:CheY-like chemotaxis protein